MKNIRDTCIEFFKNEDIKRDIVYNEIYIYIWFICIYIIFITFIILANLFILLQKSRNVSV